MEASVLARPAEHQRTASGVKRDLTAWGVALAATVMSLVAYITTVRLHGVLPYVDSISHLEEPVAAYLRTHYAGGLVLMESFGNENIAFQLPSDQLVYEGSYRQWLPSLQNPAANHIAWIIARCGHSPYPDKVCLALGPAQLSHYSLVYITADHDYRVYRLGK